MRPRLMATSALGLALIAGGALGQSSTKTYTYDELGRLTKAITSGGRNNAEAHSLCYDASGNRTRYKASLDGTAADCSAPAPSPTPTPTSGPAFSVSDASANEAENLVFTVSLSPSPTASYSVSYATAPWTASTTDYASKSGVLTFAPGETSKTISVMAKYDIKVEPTEIFYLNLSSPTGGSSIADGQGVGSIYDVCGTC